MKAREEFECAFCRTMVFKGEDYGIVYHIKDLHSCMICTIAAEHYGVSISV
jgi:hypothetical protein